ncbi:hypothetical protein DM860_002858 [Cuscuta australis]|uniref:Dolichyl-diphosphooligosaccharide--protein glycosyltransferase subunit DAD1 n=1 Tax=Cuscuta australis TaxID=267555 RepID=A0A328D0Q1_9ASTE|nr:hypothetical protein DM860_002858 [Cuscuta australis]
MAKSSASKDVQALFQSLRSAYAATPTNLKIIDLYVMFALFTALIQVVYMAIVGSFPFNSFLSGVLSCIGTAVLAVCLRIQVNKENKEFKVKYSLGAHPFCKSFSFFFWPWAYIRARFVRVNCMKRLKRKHFWITLVSPNYPNHGVNSYGIDRISNIQLPNGAIYNSYSS